MPLKTYQFSKNCAAYPFKEEIDENRTEVYPVARFNSAGKSEFQEFENLNKDLRSYMKTSKVIKGSSKG